MAVVAAEVRAFFDFARPGILCFVLNGKRVRVAAKPDHGPFRSALDERDDAVLFNALHAVDGEGREEGLELFCRPGRIHADFRMAVKIAAEFNNALGILAAEKRFKRAWHLGKAPSRKRNQNFRCIHYGPVQGGRQKTAGTEADPHPLSSAFSSRRRPIELFAYDSGAVCRVQHFPGVFSWLIIF